MDEQYFLQLVNQNKGIIYKICHSYCRHQADVEDLAQEIIYQLWKSRARFNPDFKFTTWMYRVALNTAIAHQRKLQQTGKVTELPSGWQEWEDKGMQEENPSLQLLYQFLRQLKDLDRALMLLYLEEKSYQEMADILGITSSNVGTRLGRIKEQMKKYFSLHQ